MKDFHCTIPHYGIVEKAIKTTTMLLDGFRNFSNAVLRTEALWSIADPPARKAPPFPLSSISLRGHRLYQQPTAPHPH